MTEDDRKFPTFTMRESEAAGERARYLVKMMSEADGTTNLEELEAIARKSETVHRFMMAMVERVMSYPWALRPIVGSLGAHMLAMAKTQTGKTMLMQEAALVTMNVGVNITPIMILHPHRQSFTQFAERWNGSFQKKYQHIDGLRFGVPHLIGDMELSAFQEAFRQKAKSILPCALANYAQLRKLRTWIETRYDPAQHGHIMLIMDEADLCVPSMRHEFGEIDRTRPEISDPRAALPEMAVQSRFDKRWANVGTPNGKVPYSPENRLRGRVKKAPSLKFCTSAENELRELKRSAVGMLEVTATGLPCLAGSSVTHVVYLDPPIPPVPGVAYHGHLDLAYVDLPSHAPGGDWKASGDKEALDMLFLSTGLRSRKDIGRGATSRNKVKGILLEKQARLLIKPGNTRAQHRDLIDYCRGLEGPPITIIEQNDDCLKLHWPRNHPKYAESPEMRMDKSLSISELTQMLKDDNAEDPSLHNHVVYVAGLKADRGCSYGSSDFGWMLTHMYLISNANVAAHTLVQSGGRLTGMYRDNPRLVMFGPESALSDYFVCCEALHGVGMRLQEAVPPGRTEVTTGDAKSSYEIAAGEILVELDILMPRRRWAAKSRSKRLDLNQQFLVAVNERENDRFCGNVEHAIRLYPGYKLLDHHVTLEDKLPRHMLEMLHDATFRRGPAPVGSTTREHFAALARIPSVGTGNGDSNLLADIMATVKSKVAEELKQLEAIYGPKFRLPEWVSFDPMDPEGLQPEEVSFLTATEGYRHRNTRRLTKGRNVGSGGGINYLRNTSFLVMPTPIRSEQPKAKRVEDIEFDPKYETGIIVRLIHRDDLSVVKVASDKPGEPGFITIKGPILYATSERNLVIRHSSDPAKAKAKRSLFFQKPLGDARKALGSMMASQAEEAAQADERDDMVRFSDAAD